MSILPNHHAFRTHGRNSLFNESNMTIGGLLGALQVCETQAWG
jgi:hypothetical protein|eukprot:COSAG06_NODE_848_length_11971_cov_10.199882_12_plen_43_part_00